MNDEIMRELVQTLREMRAGAPEAFEELVRQRSDYALICGHGTSAWLLVTIIIATATVKAMWLRIRDAESCDVDPFMWTLALTCICIVAITIIVPSAIYALHSYATAIAPLGQILGALGGQ